MIIEPPFVKYIEQGDQEDLLIKAGGVLSTFFDDDAGLIKSAASSAISEKMMREHRPDKNHYGVHAIAMGSSEWFSMNKNGDWWKEKDLIERHDTFVKNGHYFEEHRHSSPDLKIGDAAASAFNDDMHRVELIIHGDKRKDEEGYEAAKAGKPLTYSMSAKVAYDICSICGNEAKSSKNYCVHARKHMTQYLAKHKKFVYVINVRPRFFDISKVKNRADRIAVHIDYMFDEEMKKAASSNGQPCEDFQFSDQLAAAAGIRALPEPLTEGQATLLTKLASLEEYFEVAIQRPGNVAQDSLFQFTKQAAQFAGNRQPLGEDQLTTLREIAPDVLFHELAKRAAVLPFLDFYAYATNQTVKQASEDPVQIHARQHCLPTVFRDLRREQKDWSALENFKAASVEKAMISATVGRQESTLRKVAGANSVDLRWAKDRVLRNCLQTAPDLIKSAASIEQKDKGKFLAKIFGIYKLAFCEAAAELSDTEMNDSALLLVLAQT